MSKTKGFGVFFWITLSHEVSKHFPTRQHTRTSKTFYIFAVHWWMYPFIGGESDVPWKEEQNHGSSVADCVHTAIFQNIRGNRTPYHANQIQGDVPHASDLRSTSTTKEIDKWKAINILKVQITVIN